MSTEQHVEQTWRTPSAEEIVAMTKAHVERLETSTDDAVWIPHGMPHVLLRTVGRKSGLEHKVPLPIWRDPAGRGIVVASFAGAKAHPSWFVNLRDRVANPEVLVTTQDHAYWSVPEVLEGDDRRRTWALLTADRAWYDDYQALTDREIPLVALPETRPAV